LWFVFSPARRYPVRSGYTGTDFASVRAELQRYRQNINTKSNPANFTFYYHKPETMQRKLTLHPSPACNSTGNCIDENTATGLTAMA